MQDAKRYCREVVRIVRTLKEKRDMALNEVKLTLAIEDPTTRDQRNYMGVEVRLRCQKISASWCMPTITSSNAAASVLSDQPNPGSGRARLRMPTSRMLPCACCLYGAVHMQPCSMMGLA